MRDPPRRAGQWNRRKRGENVTLKNSEVEIREWLHGLRGQDLSDREVEEAGERLAGGGTSILPIVLDLFREEDETLLAVATETMKRWPMPRPADSLVRLLRDPCVDDMAKALILVVLERYGLDPVSPEMVGLGINLEEYPIDPATPGQGARS